MTAKPFEILLAEDNPADADMVRMALRKHDIACTLHHVLDGETAIELLKHLDIHPEAPALDLCILDMFLPKCNGEVILKRLRSSERSARTPVIAMSGLLSPAIEENTTANGVLVYFTKPSAIDEYLRIGRIANDILRQARGSL